MKRILLAALPCPSFAPVGPSRSAVTGGPGGSLVLGQVTGTGQLGPYRLLRVVPLFAFLRTTSPSSSTEPSPSPAPSRWRSHPTTSTGSRCRTFPRRTAPPAPLIFLANKPALYLRANVLTYTAATDLTSKVVITYTRGTN